MQIITSRKIVVRIYMYNNTKANIKICQWVRRLKSEIYYLYGS